MKYDELAPFAAWWYKTKPIMAPKGCPIIRYDGKITEVVLYRSGHFQVQLCTIAPNTEVPDHVHPEVDAYEVYAGGDVTFRRNAEKFAQAIADQNIRILPTDMHGATIGAAGGSFFSIQHWVGKDKPTFVTQNWRFADNNETEHSRCIP